MCAYAHDAAVLFNQIGYICAHARRSKLEKRRPWSARSSKIPLRHQREEFAAHRQVGEVGHRDAMYADLAGQPRDFLMRQLEKLVDQPGVRRSIRAWRMHDVAAEIPQEIGVLLQHRYLYLPGTCQRITGISPAGPRTRQRRPLSSKPPWRRHQYPQSFSGMIVGVQSLRIVSVGSDRVCRVRKQKKAGAD